MEIIKGVQDFPDLPTRMGKRPITIRGPLHVQCGGHSDEGVLHQLVQQVIAWPGIETGPLPIGTADLVSLKLAEDFATHDSSLPGESLVEFFSAHQRSISHCR